MAKKIVSLLLAGVMVLSMTACGSKGEEETKKQEKTEIVTEISEPIELQYWHSISNPIHLEVLENLVHDMPERPERVESVKQTIRNWVNNEYPTSRSLSLKIAGFRREGYESDPNKDYLEVIDRMTMEDILRFYRENIQDHLMIYAIVGNSKSMDMEKLSKFGQIVKVTKKDIYR